MTLKQFHRDCARLIRKYHPEKEEATTMPRWQCFTFPNGIEIGCHKNWISIGLSKINETLARKISSRPFKHDCWWKWNITFFGPSALVLEESLKELKRRLDILAGHFPEMKPTK